MNQVTICGYLAKDFELSQSKNNTDIARNFVGISTKRIIKNGNDITEMTHTDWIPLAIFGKRALVAKEYLKKGDKFLGTGRIFTSTYEDEKGETKYSWQVIINHFEFVHKDMHKESTKETSNPPLKEAQQINEADMEMIVPDEQNNEVNVF